jgi:PKD repeat protein
MKKHANILLYIFIFIILFFIPSCANGYIIQINGNSMHISNSTGYVDNTDSNIIAYKVNDTLNFEAVAVDNVSSDIINSGYMKWDFGDGSETTYQQNGVLKNTTHKYTFPFPYPVSWCGYKENIGYPKSITYNWLVVGDVKNTLYNFKVDTSHDTTSYDVVSSYDNTTNETIVNITYYSDCAPGNYSSFKGLTVDTTPVEITPNKKDIVEGDSVLFNISVNESIVFCMWSFGDGTHSFERSPTHIYDKSGFYYPQVLIVDEYGRVRVGYATIDVERARGGYVYWVMGPVNYGGQAYTYVYNLSGDSNNNQGNSYTDPYDITYKENTNTIFQASGGWGYWWKWDFGDGSETDYEYNQKMVLHKYKFPFMWPFFWMTYGYTGSWWKSDTFNFIVVGDVGNTKYNFLPSPSHDKTTYDYSYDEKNHIVNISYYSDNTNKPVYGLKLKDGYYTDIAATASPTEIDPGDYVHFNCTYVGDPLFVMWCFGDGECSYETNPVHKYTSSGLFYPHVYIVDKNGDVALGITPPIGVGGYSSFPQLYVSPSVVHTNEQLNITIVEPAHYVNATHIISLGDGNTIPKAPGYSPYTFNYSYPSEGVYEIQMDIPKYSIQNGKSVYVIDNHAPNAVLYVYPTPASYIQDIIFNPVNSYDPDEGRSINIYDPYGNIIDTYTISPNSPMAQIYGYNLTVYNSTGDKVYNVSYNELKECQHQFEVGNYTANLTVWDGDGKTSSTIVHFAVINKKPVAEFSYYPTSPKINQIVYFDASSSYDPEGAISKYVWNFGDGTQGFGKYVSHKYTNFGTYHVTLTVYDEKNAHASASKDITISGIKANFTYKPTYILVNTPVNFTDTSVSYYGNITKRDWNFGDGLSSNAKTIVHSYSRAGIYFVELHVENEFGESDRIVKIIPVHAKGENPPVAKFTFTINGTNVSFDASDSYDMDGTIVKYIWDFGDGSNGTGKTAWHIYSDYKAYKASLTVVDNDGLTGNTFRFIDISKSNSTIPIPNYVNILIILATLISMGYIMRGLK